MIIRQATPDDVPALARVFYDAVRDGPGPYTRDQRRAWMPAPPDPDAFAARLAPLHTVAAADAAGVCGFMTVGRGGYIDLVFILPRARGTGLFRRLFARIESVARAGGETGLRTHASLTAQPAFRAVGFSVIQHESVERGGEHLQRAEMGKMLT